MYKDGRFINAGTNEFYRWGKQAVIKASAALTPNEAGFYSIPADGGKFWTFGTSMGKYGEYAKIGDTFFSVNGRGMIWAKAGTEKGEVFVDGIRRFIQEMINTHLENVDFSSGEYDDVADQDRMLDILARRYVTEAGLQVEDILPDLLDK